jgi:hypothetical protein
MALQPTKSFIILVCVSIIVKEPEYDAEYHMKHLLHVPYLPSQHGFFVLQD